MIKDSFYSVVPLNWFLRVVCLSNIYRNGIYLVESKSFAKSITYVISFGLFNIFCLYHKLINFQLKRQTSFITFSGSVQMTYWFSYSEYIIDIYFVYKYKQVSHLKYFKTYNHIDTILGNACYDEIRKTITQSVVLAIVIFLLNSLFDYISWALVEGWKLATIYSVDYLYFLLNMLTLLDIISHIIQIEFRLKMISDLLQDCNTKHVIKLNYKDPKTREFSDDNNSSKSLTSLKTLCTGKHVEIIWFSRCYLLLVEQVAYLNNSYGLRVLVYCTNLLMNIINNLNLGIRIVNGTLKLYHPYGSLTFLPCISSIFRALNYSVMVIMLMYRCEQAYAQRERILEIIDNLLIDENNCNVLKTHLLEFRNFLITRPIKFHAAKFFTMDYTLLVSLSSAVVTYTIIILQSMQDK